MWNISAEPMPSRISTSVRAFHSWYSSAGSASPAERLMRRLERSTESMRSERSMLLNMVGTPVSSVGRKRSIWSKRW